MHTSPIDNATKPSVSQTDNSEQTPKIPIVGLAHPEQAISEQALPPVQELEKTTEHLNTITKDLDVRVQFKVSTSVNGPMIVAIDIDKNAVIRQVEHHIRIQQDFDTTKGIILSTNA